MKKILLTAILFCCILASMFSQSRITLDNAISDFSVELVSRSSAPQFSDNKSMAVISFETGSQGLMDYFFRTIVEKINNEGGYIFERSRIEPLLEELNFSLTRYVSIEGAQEIGNFVGADTVIYGSIASLASTNTGNDFLMTITGAVTETGQIMLQKNYYLQMDSRLAGLLGITRNESRLWTLGVSVGSSLSRPLVIGTVHGTIAPFRYSFLELGVDVGLLSRQLEESYYSICPFAHYAFFWPFESVGAYAGAGAGYWFSNLSPPDKDKSTERLIVADGIIGINVMDKIDISYTLRTTFKAITNKFSVGYTYRFK